MLISKQWLHDFVFLPDSLEPEELARKLTLHTVEVEGWNVQDELLENVVIGVVKSVEKHKDADRLNVCQVFDGTEDVQIVCGGSNVKEGMKVALGKLGAKVKWHGEGEKIELKKTKIRGEVSLGMICAAEEIGLGDMFKSDDDKAILDLSNYNNANAGDLVAEVIKANDVIIDIDNKSMTHRPDLWGHYGIARELAVMYRKQFKAINPAEIKAGTEKKLDINISDSDINNNACIRYQGVVLEGITIEPSPEWLQQRLQSIGINPINNIVDITNYVMFELGQPMHAFDADKLAKNDNDDNYVINVRNAKAKEKFVTLDGTERELDESVLVIADAKKAIAVAGIMGGKNSEVDSKTNKILIECANFDFLHIRKASSKLGLRTDASTRFEKTLDPNMTQMALRRCVALVRSLNQDVRVVSNVADSGVVKLNQGPIKIETDFISQKIGADISEKSILDILERLGFDVKSKKGLLSITVPTWRATKDVAIKEDIVEEVARMYGYDQIKTVLPNAPIYPAQIHKLEKTQHEMRAILAHKLGFTEVMTYSFVSENDVTKMNILDQKRLELDNPVAKDRPFLRKYLSTNLVDLIEKNSHKSEEIALFELGKVFLADEVGERAQLNSDELLPKQPTMLGLMYSQKNNSAPYSEVLDGLTKMLTALGYSYLIKKTSPTAFGHPGRSAKIEIEGVDVAWITELHPKIQNKIGIDNRVALAELNVDLLLTINPTQGTYEPIPTYPGIERDIAFVVSKEILHVDMKYVISKTNDLIKQVKLFDVYEGEHVKKNHKSVGYRILYINNEKTLKSSEIDIIEKEVIKNLKDKFNIEIR